MAGHANFSNIFPKTSEDAFVEYFLFPDAGVSGDEEKMNELLIQVSIEAVTIIGDYLWQKDLFTLRLAKDLTHFCGSIHYDVNIEDEWFTVHILKQLTIKFPSLIARVIDQDGEFLLIEASEYLPKWAESDETCQGRVYIHQGSVHLIGEMEAGEVNASLMEMGPLEMSSAISLLRKYSGQTVAHPFIQEAIRKRIGNYPEKMLENTHHANLFLPRKVAMMLKERPSLVSAAVRAFHEKDAIDMKIAREMPHFRPIGKLVKSRVRFTKTLYAMLSSEDFYPDSKLNWNFPSTNSSDFKAYSFGAKLTLGFELLLARSPTSNSKSLGSRRWMEYEEKLKKFDYYHGLIEGSRDYNVLQKRAMEYFQSSVVSDLETTVDDQATEYIQAFMNPDKGDHSFLEEEEYERDSLPDDDDSWMDINSDHLESLLAAQFQTKISDQKLDQIPDKLKEFMQQMSDFSGVEPQMEEHESNHDGSEDEDGGLDPMDFRADDFVSAMDKLLLELGRPANDFELSEPSSEEEEANAKLTELEKKYNVKDPQMKKLMNRMDEELFSTAVGKTFQSSSEGKQPFSTSAAAYEPVDIDMNALTNILDSFQSQEDSSGPSTTLLRNVGFDITKAKK